mmetsp:Transcript_24244/g.42936  ORF Transcript_24244/g.42936 Transcript_24244/m.42936 type:complete len:500 (+) Transcript_24244:106-1605(+)|eukprot:CAMPEP_0197526008 /NCGR_PEP_ID=MMETSP1318-20131121/15681_1 /TAXON_ID=552666 /ORGANISM="Partenskyella glossopodia, Strain RCC365" /LENGTH=499 /DNA_ID=CAMNT_0043079917 /DNA_START=22 /DNA_END=1521 /DNA_ORIENTATION=-
MAHRFGSTLRGRRNHGLQSKKHALLRVRAPPKAATPSSAARKLEFGSASSPGILNVKAFGWENLTNASNAANLLPPSTLATSISFIKKSKSWSPFDKPLEQKVDKKEPLLRRSVSELFPMEDLEGTNRPLLCQDENKKRYVFKDSTLEPTRQHPDSTSGPADILDGFSCSPNGICALKRGVRYGDASRKEVVAYNLDHARWAGIPHTILTQATLKSTGQGEIATTETEGSLQEWVENIGTADDWGSPLFTVESVHRIGILDVRICNLDRHLGNLLVAPRSSSNSTTKQPQADYMNLTLIPIDHAYCLPDFRHLGDINFEWLHWRQTEERFSDSTKAYIADLDPYKDAAIIKAAGLPDASAITCIMMTDFLKQGVRAGLSLHELGRMMQRPYENDGNQELSEVEGMVDRALVMVGGRSKIQNGKQGIPAAEFKLVKALNCDRYIPNPPLQNFLNTFSKILAQRILKRRHSAIQRLSSSDKLKLPSLLRRSMSCDEILLSR